MFKVEDTRSVRRTDGIISNGFRRDKISINYISNRGSEDSHYTYIRVRPEIPFSRHGPIFTTMNSIEAFIFWDEGLGVRRGTPTWEWVTLELTRPGKGKSNFRQPNGVDWFPVTDI